MKRITLRTASILGVSAWAIASGCSGGSGSAEADGDGINIGNGGDGNGGDDDANDNSAGNQNGADAGALEIDAGVGIDDTNDGDAGTDGAGGATGTGGATSNAGAAGTGTAGAASTPTPVEPTVLVPFPEIVGPGHIEVDDEYVYWTSAWVGADPPMPLPTASGGYVLRVPKNGGEVSALYESPSSLGQNFAMDATHLYVSEGLDIYTTLIIKVAKDGSDAVQLAQSATGGAVGPKVNFAIDGQSLYFEGRTTNGDIESVPLDGGSVVSLLSAHPLPEGYSYFPEVFGLTTDGTSLHYTGGGQGIFQVPVAGDTPLRISPENVEGVASFSHNTTWPAVKDGFVYWHYYGYIYKVPVGGGALTTVVEPTDLEKGSSEPQLVIDGDYLYYFNRGLQKAALDGSSRVTLFEDAGTYNAGAGLAIDDTHAYMFAASGQSIIKVPK